MLALNDSVKLSFDALRAHRLRAALTLLGLTMGVATLITVVTLIQGANVYVETKIANLGSDVFQVARTPFAVTDFELVMKALKYKHIYWEDYVAVQENCRDCRITGASGQATVKVRFGNLEVTDSTLLGQTPSMVEIDSRNIDAGRFFSDTENQHATAVCIIGNTLRDKFFAGRDPSGETLRLGDQEFRVVGASEKIGSVLGQDADNFVIVPLNTFLRMRGARYSLTINVKVPGDPRAFERAQDQVRLTLRGRRQLRPGQPDDFFFGTKDSYIALWNQISGAFFAVFILVSSISAIVGGIVIMNVMLVSVTERTKEIGIRRAVGATGGDILRQFLTESVIQCIAGGMIGIGIGFLCALALRQFTSFPAAVQTQVAILGVALSSAIGLFFGIYPATRAAKLDPVEALRSD